MIQIVCFRPVFAVFQIINIYISKSRKRFNLISLKMLTTEYPKWKNLTVAPATFATVWIRAWHTHARANLALRQGHHFY